MQPLSVITAIVFGSATAASFGFVSSLVIFIVLQGKHPEFASELWPLARTSVVILMLAAISGLSLYALLKENRWRWFAQAGMWCSVIAVVSFYTLR
jgi:hypothetical protein